MHQEKKVLPVAVTLAVLVGIALGALGFYFLMRQSAPQLASDGSMGSGIYIAASTSSMAGATTTGTTATTSTGITSAATLVDTGSWQTYTNYELGFSMQYPPDVTIDDTSDPTDVTFTFPSSYFSTVMKDTDSVSVSVNATCTPVTSFSATGPIPSQTVTMNGISFTENYQYSVGAGNHEALTTYDTDANDSCYRISFSSRGANDAGFYVSDPSQIAEINAAHAADVAQVEAVANAMIQSFAFADTAAGENEAFYSSQAAGQAAGPGGSALPAGTSSTIAITTVSPIPVSVGGILTIDGSGFSAGHTVVWISNGAVNGVLWSGSAPSDSLITASVPSQVCTQDQNVSAPDGTDGTGGGTLGTAGTCPSYLPVDSGIYTLTVANQNGTTGQVYIKVQ